MTRITLNLGRKQLRGLRQIGNAVHKSNGRKPSTSDLVNAALPIALGQRKRLRTRVSAAVGKSVGKKKSRRRR